jgi:glycosyltransferase involved in cell wall biosynthesis
MISIIIPTYNDAKYLTKTIASCLVQDIQPEIIVVDDYSENEFEVSGLLLMRCCKLIRNKKNLGLAEARDEGIKVAKGEFILPLDTSDWLYPHVLGKMLDAIQDADIVYGDMTERDDGKILSPPGKDGITIEGMKKLNQLWCTSLFRKSIWKEVGGYKNGLHTSYEDYFLYNKCLMEGAKFKYIPETIYRHTYDPNSMLSQLHKKTDYYNELARQPLYKNNLMYEL